MIVLDCKSGQGQDGAGQYNKEEICRISSKCARLLGWMRLAHIIKWFAENRINRFKN
jgi:hypothetical protein|nr:hypothetical protein [Herbaspirillum sp. ASV7]